MKATLFLFLLIAAWDLDNVMAAPKKVIGKCCCCGNRFVNWATPNYGYGYGYPAYPSYPPPNAGLLNNVLEQISKLLSEKLKE